LILIPETIHREVVKISKGTLKDIQEIDYTYESLNISLPFLVVLFSIKKTNPLKILLKELINKFTNQKEIKEIKFFMDR